MLNRQTKDNGLWATRKPPSHIINDRRLKRSSCVEGAIFAIRGFDRIDRDIFIREKRRHASDRQEVEPLQAGRDADRRMKSSA
jgi:hypothetical protein